ncbi:hypothetical protein YB2330_006453 [Saitoella coloradoensis]
MTSPRQKSTYKYFLPHSIRWSDVDRYAHVNNAIYHHYFDTIANEYLVNHCGMDPERSELVGLMVASRVRFYAPMTFPGPGGGEITLGLSVSKIGRTSVEYRIGVWQGDGGDGDGDGEACAVCFATHVFVERVGHGKVEGMGERVRRGLERILVEEGVEVEGGKGKGKL